MMTRVNQLEDIEEHDAEDFLCVLCIFLGAYRMLAYFYSFVLVYYVFFLWSVQGVVKSL